LLNYSNVVVGYIRIPQSLHPRSYYNNVQQEAAACASGLLQDVLLTLKTLPNYQSELLPVLSRATVDAENQIVACNLFVSGPNSGVWNRGLWGIRTSLDAPFELSLGGKQVSSFQLSPMGTELELATFCHENGHMLCGFPDLYDYDEDSSGGSGAFCLMGAGMGVPTNPAQFCAYLKQAAGWASVTELDAASELTATVAAGDGANFNHFYRYTKPGVPTEYFLIENRQQTGHDLDIPGAGIVIWHVDELGDRDDQRTNYNSTHSNYELTLVQADDQWDLENNNNTGDATDLFYAGNPSPAYSNVFSDQSAPSARWWDGSESRLLLANFSASAMDMTFKVGGLSQTAPKILGQPRNCLALMDQTASFKVTASGSNPMFYQWRCNGLNLEVNSHLIGTHAAELSISKVQAADAADYSVVVSNAFGCVTSSVASLNVIADLGAALNATELVWKTYGDGLWAPELAATHDGVAAAQTPVLNYGQSASLQTTVNGPGKLTCWWRVRSQSDTLAFYLGGFPKGKFID
ncbi:MAG TPA: immunoglobulin domain-containing protein, partial [Candidatus Sulfotelmatobacter sp.]|nr:immunoglobulin domain-containing protein [Candidatus Sulfotelmatobacter sp.]